MITSSGTPSGKIIEGKSPRQIANIKILDPACGSGSFLLGAYQCLINYHLRYYLEHPKEAQTLSLFPYWKMSPDDFTLPIHEKAKILRNNIFGVDIDPQAVEITMMSLYLKALEGERGLLPKKQHLLPPLGNNIKCGNSLIGYDIFDALPIEGGGLGRGWDDETKSRINPFDWNSKAAGFGEIIENGGFDVVIGNPPYVRQEMICEFKDYFQKHYEVYHGTADLYAYFIEKAFSLLEKGGLFSYIVANKWMRANYGKPLRRWMKTRNIEEIIDFGDLPVFETVTTYPCIIRIRRGGPVWPSKSGQPHRVAPTFYTTDVRTLNFNDLQAYVKDNRFKVLPSSLSDKGWSLVDEKSQALLNKLHSSGIPLSEYVKEKIYYGIKTGLNEAFVIDEKTKDRLIAEDSKSAELIKPFLVGKDIKRYEPPPRGRYLILIPKGWTSEQIRHSREGGNPENTGLRVKPGMTETGAWQWFSESYPAIAAHLKPFAEKGKKRYDKGEYWWELRTCDYYAEFEQPKIIVPSIVKSASYVFDTDGFYSNDKTTIISTDDLYLLGILNSKVSDFAMHSIASTKQGGYFEYKPMYLQQLTIRTIDFNNPSEKAVHDKLVSLVDSMLELHKKKSSIPPSAERNKIEREIAITDEKIDEVVYGLYGITEEKRKINT